jgi:hypothetical protein
MRNAPVAILRSANRSSESSRSSIAASTVGASDRERWRSASTAALIDSGAPAGAGTGAGQSSATVSAVSPT